MQNPDTPANVFEIFTALKAFDIMDIDILTKHLDDLLGMELDCPEAIQAFVHRRDELEKHFETETSEAYFLMTRDVANEEWKQRHEHIEKAVTPVWRTYTEKLNKKFLGSPAVADLPAPFDVLRRNWSSEVEIFSPDNVDLLKEVDLLSMKITEIMGKRTADWKGEEVPLAMLQLEMEKTDRDNRKQAFEKLLNRQVDDVDQLDELFGELMLLRQRIAENAGFDTYTEYRFKEFKRFEWGPKDCFAFHAAVKKHLLPLQNALAKRRKSGLGLDTLRPYDGGCDPYGREPMIIYEKGHSDALVEGAGNIIRALDSELFRYFKGMRDNDLFDLDARKNKAPGGYMCKYPVYEQASVFWNGTGSASDLMVLLHELGHCFHYFLGRAVRPFSLQDWTAEVAEVGSMSMEFFGLEEMHNYLSSEQVARMKEERLRTVVGLLLMTARGDEFQHWMYAHPDHSIEQRRNKWIELNEIYNPTLDRTGYTEQMGMTGWQFLHILQLPFYLIDYAISEILSLTLWDRYKHDPADAIEHYKKGCALAGSRPVPEIYQAFGSRFSFGEDVIAPLAKRLAMELHLDL